MHSNVRSDTNGDFALEAHWQNDLIERTWRELGGKISRERIREVAVEATAKYADAKVSAFVPIVAQRFMREKLKEEIQKAAQNDETVFHAGPPHSPDRKSGIAGSHHGT